MFAVKSFLTRCGDEADHTYRDSEYSLAGTHKPAADALWSKFE